MRAAAKIKSRRLNVVVDEARVEGGENNVAAIYKAYEYKRSPSVQRTYCVQKMMVKCGKMNRVLPAGMAGE